MTRELLGTTTFKTKTDSDETGTYFKFPKFKIEYYASNTRGGQGEYALENIKRRHTQIVERQNKNTWYSVETFQRWDKNISIDVSGNNLLKTVKVSWYLMP